MKKLIYLLFITIFLLIIGCTSKEDSSSQLTPAERQQLYEQSKAYHNAVNTVDKFIEKEEIKKSNSQRDSVYTAQLHDSNKKDYNQH